MRAINTAIFANGILCRNLGQGQRETALATPNEVRGRVCAFEYLVSTIAPQLGNVRAGLLALTLPATAVVALGGLSTFCTVLLLACRLPDFSMKSVEIPEAKED